MRGEHRQSSKAVKHGHFSAENSLSYSVMSPRDHNSDAGKQLFPNNVLFEHINKEKNEHTCNMW